MMQIVRVIIESLSCFLELGLGIYLFSANGQRRFSKRNSYFLFILLCSIYAIGLKFIRNDITLFIFSIFVTIAAASLLYDCKWYVGIFISIIFSVISGASELIVMETTSIISKETFEVANENIYVYVFGLSATKMFTFFVITLIRKGRHKSFRGVGNKRFAQLMLLPIATVLIAIIFSVYINETVSNIIKAVSIVSLFVLISANIMTFYIVDSQQELISTRNKLKASEMLLDNQRKYYDDIFHSQQEIRKTRHDLKNIFIAVLSEINNENVEEAKLMISSKLLEVDKTINLSSVEDSVVETVIYAKKSEAEKQGIELNTNVSINKPILNDKLDLAVLVANLLDNAIEATNDVAEERIIDFSFITDKDNLIVFCKNPTVNEIDINQIKTTKKDPSKHGLGIMSIKSVAEKYNGSYVIECNNGFFSGTVVMTNSKKML